MVAFAPNVELERLANGRERGRGGGVTGMAVTEHDVGERAAGEWLFQREGRLFGPLPLPVLIERLERGELSADTPVAPDHGGAFRPLRETPAFIDAVARVEAHRKVHGELEVARQAERRRLVRRAILWGTVATAVAGGVAAGVIAFARSRGPVPTPAEVRISAPLIAVAAGREAEGADEELFEYVEGDPAAAPDSPPAGRTRSRGTKVPGPAGGPPAARADADGLATEASYDEVAMNRVIAANQARLVACVKEQATKDPTFRGEVPPTFTVDNNGRVGRLWVDKPGHAEGSFAKCLEARLAEWRFPAFAGERPSISLSFRVGP